MLMVFRSDDHVRKSVPQIDIALITPKAYLPIVWAGTNGKIREFIDQFDCARIKREVARAESPGKLLVDVKQCNAMHAVCNSLIHLKREFKPNRTQRIKNMDGTRGGIEVPADKLCLSPIAGTAIGGRAIAGAHCRFVSAHHFVR